MAVEFPFEVVDRMSGPMVQMSKGAEVLDRQLAQLDGSMKKALGEGPNRYKGALNQLAGASGGVGSSLLELGSVMGFVQGLTSKAVDAVVSLAAKTVDLGVSIVRFAVGTASMKRDALNAFELIEGSAGAAAKTFDRLAVIADKTPFETKDVVRFGKVLRSTGFTIGETTDLLAGMSDVGAVQGEEGIDRARGLMDAIVKIKGRDQLNMETLEAVLNAGAAAGVNMENIARSIAQRRNVDYAQGLALLKGGQIKGVEGITAILDTIKRETDKGGPLGKATLAFAEKSLGGQWSTFSDRIARFFMDIDLQPLVDLLKGVNDLLSPDAPTGRRIREFASKTLGGMFKRAAEFLTPENVTQALNTLMTLVEKAGSFFKEVTAGFFATFDVTPLTGGLKQLDAAAAGGKVNWTAFGAAVGDLANALIKVVEVGRKAMDLFAGDNPFNKYVFSQLDQAANEDARKDAAARAEARAREAGVNAATGLAIGLDDAGAGAAMAAEALGDKATLGVKKSLQIQSPSKVFEELGWFTGEGFRRGLAANDIDSALDFSAPASGIAADAAAAVGGGGDRSVHVEVGDIYVSGDDPEAAARVGRETRARVSAELLDLLEDLALTG